MKYSDQKKVIKNKYSSHTPVLRKDSTQSNKQASQILKQIDNKIQQINHLNILNHLKTQNHQFTDKENLKILMNHEKESKHLPLSDNIYCLDQKNNQLKQISTTLNLNQLCNDDIKIGNFKLEQVLGQGSFAQVRLCIQKNSQIKYAMKIYDKNKLNDTQKMNNIKREISILKRIDHKNIIKLAYALQDSKSIYLVMEYISSQSLASFVKSKAKKCLEQQEGLYIFQQIVNAVQYLHSKNIAHRDIKLDNILLMTDNYVKLIDFGFSICTPESQKINVFCGTPSYMSPELVGKIPHNPMSSDIWSLGILLYRILFGDYPFKGANDKDLYKAIQFNKIPLPNDLNENITTILRGCLEKSITKRFTIDQVAKNLFFLQTVNIYAL